MLLPISRLLKIYKDFLKSSTGPASLNLSVQWNLAIPIHLALLLSLSVAKSLPARQQWAAMCCGFLRFTLHTLPRRQNLDDPNRNRLSGAWTGRRRWLWRSTFSEHASHSWTTRRSWLNEAAVAASSTVPQEQQSGSTKAGKCDLSHLFYIFNINVLLKKKKKKRSWGNCNSPKSL